MSFVDRVFEQLSARPSAPLVREVHGSGLVSASGAELIDQVARARGALQAAGVAPGDRVVLLSPNAIRWVAADLAILAEGAVVVPLYARQDPQELVEIMHDCDPKVVWTADEALSDAIRAHWSDAPIETFDAVFAHDAHTGPLHAWNEDDGCTIVYTSGTSGTAKGVVLPVKGIDYMLPITAQALESMMSLGEPVVEHRVFHYLPFCFAGSRIVLWTCLWRGNSIMVSTNLDDLATELGTAAPHYVLNVPMLLERIKNGVEKGIREQPAPIQWLYDAALRAHRRPRARKRDRWVLAAAEWVLFRRLRTRIGPNLRCLICGSAPLGEDTQRWFEMIGIAVYQVYGLTETTAIVTMDTPPQVKPGRVGSALPGVETKLSDEGELLVRGPNVFAAYWRRPEATAQAFDGDWFRTGDQAEVDPDGYWRIVGRVKNLLVPTSGHNVAPEPIEQQIIETIEGVEQAVVVGHARPWLAALVSGEVQPDALERGLEAINQNLPHYRRIREVHIAEEPFSIENGLLTANRKLRRKAIETSYSEAIDAMYSRRSPA